VYTDSIYVTGVHIISKRLSYLSALQVPGDNYDDNIITYLIILH
jgi:hypothetical protein